MKSSSAQIVKEARQLAWPWTILMLAGLFVLARPWFSALPALPMSSAPWQRLTEWILPIGAFFGSSLLAALPLGNEFQFRTLAMRFAQPVERRDLWRQKFLVTVAAVAPPAVIYCLAIGQRFGWPFAVMAAIWIVVTIAGVIPFTLIARSTLGGMVLAQFGTTGVSFGWMYYEKHGQFPPLVLPALAIVLVAYTAVMIWLGRRMFLRFQAVDGMQAGEAFVPGARLVPRAVAEWFRSRPAQPLSNLLRREFHLLRTLWPLSVLYLAAWIFLVVFHQVPDNRPESRLVAFAMTVILGVLIAVLAGTLSLGEEKTAGTHEWHMTLPVSISAQWGVKLLFALFTSLVCTALLPMSVLLLGGWVSGSAAQFLTGKIAVVWIAEAVGITFVAFWCACVVRGTVQATLWVFPVCFAIVFANNAPWLLAESANLFEKFVPGIFSRLDPIAVWRAVSRLFPILESEKSLVIAIAPLLAVGLIQSHRLFRAQVAANKLRIVQCALPLLIVAFLCGSVGVVYMAVLRESSRQQYTILRETDAAIAAAQAADPRPRLLSMDDLAKAAPLSEVTQHWLRNASITVASAPDRVGTGPGRYFPGRMMFSVPSSRLQNGVPYSAVVRTASGTQCSLMFQIQKEGPVGFVTAICQ
jgi:TM2 domain-containing membrane protein YozV